MWDRVMLTTSNSTAGAITLEEMNRFIDHLKEMGVAHPWTFEVSPGMLRRIKHLDRFRRLYQVHPVPRHKLRKCQMRRWYKTHQKLKVHMARIEHAEIAREDAIMQRTEQGKM